MEESDFFEKSNFEPKMRPKIFELMSDDVSRDIFAFIDQEKEKTNFST